MKLDINDFEAIFKIGALQDVVISPRYSSPMVRSYAYNSDGMRLTGKGLNFLRDEKFIRSYSIGMGTKHRFGRSPGDETSNAGIEYRVYVAVWAAQLCSALKGNFAEFGVNTGITSHAICNYLDFKSLEKSFFLFDTFDGIPEDMASPGESLENVRQMNELYYRECFEEVRQSFSPYPNVKLIRGRVPESLSTVDVGELSFCHIDMNIAYPEGEALKYVFPRLVVGGVILFDDYGWISHNHQRETVDSICTNFGVTILELPTGQGMIFKVR